MWIITPAGFFSIVQKTSDIDAGTLTIRARVAEDLDNLRDVFLPSLSATICGEGTDYRYRAVAEKFAMARALGEMALQTDYSNFKGEVARQQGHAREGLYHDIWHTLYKLQTNPSAYTVPRHKRTAAQPGQLAIPKADSYGCVMFNGNGEVLLREVAGHFGGYCWTFAKGRPDPGETPQQTAERETLEETAHRGEIVGVLPKVYAGTTRSTAFLMMKKSEHPVEPFSAETAAIGWFSFGEAYKRIALSTTDTGRKRDQEILADAKEWVSVNLRASL